jgi:hypothetical protein
MLYLHRVVLDHSEIDFFELHDVKGTQVATILANFVENHKPHEHHGDSILDNFDCEVKNFT